ncbi:hypothetical protein Q3G72_023744 [Acer saccharum]|nr:hypothetical protein Q3G72_023744 [Acer saccharum]
MQSHKCPDFIKVQYGRRSFSVSVWEDPTQISYNNILQWLGLDWDDDGGFSSPGSAKSKEEVGGVAEVEGEELGLDITHQNNHQRGDDRLGNFRSKRIADDRGMVEVERFSLGKEKNNNGEHKNNNCKGKEIVQRISNQQVGRSLAFKEALMLSGKTGGGCWNSSSEDTDRGTIVISPKFRGETSKMGLGQKVASNIVIDLGCGLIDEGGKGPSNAQVLEAMKGPNKTDVRILKRPHNEAASVGDSKELEEENCSSTDNQVSHVSATQYSNLVGEETSKVCNQEIGKRRNTAYGRKTLNSIKRHDMITRKDRINEENILGSMGCSDSIRSRGRGRWKLEEEVAKVIEKGLDLGVINGQAASKGSVEVPIDEQNNRNLVEWSYGGTFSRLNRL